jgi:hypothetical protein
MAATTASTTTPLIDSSIMAAAAFETELLKLQLDTTARHYSSTLQLETTARGALTLYAPPLNQ